MLGSTQPHAGLHAWSLVGCLQFSIVFSWLAHTPLVTFGVHLYQLAPGRNPPRVRFTAEPGYLVGGPTSQKGSADEGTRSACYVGPRSAPRPKTDPHDARRFGGLVCMWLGAWTAAAGRTSCVLKGRQNALFGWWRVGKV